MAHPEILPFLMFQGGVAEEAMRTYVALFPDSAVEEIERFGPGGQQPEGSIQRARFSLRGQRVLCFDSPVAHAFAIFRPRTA